MYIYIDEEKEKESNEFSFLAEDGEIDGFFTSSSLPPHGSASARSSENVSGESARRRAVRRASRWRRRFVRWRSAVSSGVRKKVSSASEGRSDHPSGESGLTGWWDAVWMWTATATASGDELGLRIFEAS